MANELKKLSIFSNSVVIYNKGQNKKPDYYFLIQWLKLKQKSKITKRKNR